MNQKIILVCSMNHAYKKGAIPYEIPHFQDLSLAWWQISCKLK
jgi:hypothetical protein